MKAFTAFIKLFDVPPRSVKINISVIYFFESGIRIDRVNINPNFMA